MTSYIQVVTTTDKREDAHRIARHLIEKRLAACVQLVGPIRSLYRWKGNIEEADEWQCYIKTRADLWPTVEREIKLLHPYETPEIMALPILAGSPDYLNWIDDETSPG